MATYNKFKDFAKGLTLESQGLAFIGIYNTYFYNRPLDVISNPQLYNKLKKRILEAKSCEPITEPTQLKILYLLERFRDIIRHKNNGENTPYAFKRALSTTKTIKVIRVANIS